MARHRNQQAWQTFEKSFFKAGVFNLPTLRWFSLILSSPANATESSGHISDTINRGFVDSLI
jgi:hypothetical protein